MRDFFEVAGTALAMGIVVVVIFCLWFSTEPDKAGAGYLNWNE